MKGELEVRDKRNPRPGGERLSAPAAATAFARTFVQRTPASAAIQRRRRGVFAAVPLAARDFEKRSTLPPSPRVSCTSSIISEISSSPRPPSPTRCTQSSDDGSRAALSRTSNTIASRPRAPPAPPRRRPIRSRARSHSSRPRSWRASPGSSRPRPGRPSPPRRPPTRARPSAARYPRQSADPARMWLRSIGHCPCREPTECQFPFSTGFNNFSRRSGMRAGRA